MDVGGVAYSNRFYSHSDIIAVTPPQRSLRHLRSHHWHHKDQVLNPKYTSCYIRTQNMRSHRTLSHNPSLINLGEIHTRASSSIDVLTIVISYFLFLTTMVRCI
ncbi:hypothetical protein VNO77_37132 [Canavalia gladiata]|uniref:Uncharacterized protein n=1 Tax=Canavalia gladiata TaxID=3824 RepID=A0AAN9KAI0_CANGL